MLELDVLWVRNCAVAAAVLLPRHKVFFFLVDSIDNFFSWWFESLVGGWWYRSERLV